jgi:hypothetical protein
MLNHKKIFVILLFAILTAFPLVTFSTGDCRELEVPIPGLTSTCLPALPDYIMAIFNFSLMIIGIVVFGALIYGGFRYLTSAGNPSAMADAKDQIFSALLGLIILFSAWLILNTINPELVILGQPTKTTTGCSASNPCPGLLVCIYDCSSGTCSTEGICAEQPKQWGCSSHTTPGVCGGDSNCQWCSRCSGTQANSYQKDICLDAGMTCMYGGTCAIGCGGATCASNADCKDPAKPTCKSCACQ